MHARLKLTAPGKTKLPAALIAAVMGLALALAGCNDSGEAAKEPEIRPVRTQIVDPRPIEDDRSAVGEIAPRYESDLAFRVSGKLVSRSVDVGAVVKKDDLLARLDDADYANKLKSAQANVDSAKAALEEARTSEERQKQLLSSGTTTRARYDDALRSLNSAEAQLESAEASYQLAADQLKYTELRAEFDGVVTGVGAEPGQVVSTGQMIVRLARPDDKDAIFSVSEATLRGKPDELPEVKVSLLSYPEVTADGVLRELSPVADPKTRTYQVKVTLKDPPAEMRFGASVTGRMVIETEPVVVLPGSALFDDQGKPAVWLFDETAGAVTLKPVTVNRYETDRVVIADGLEKGDIVVTAGVNRLREGQKVRLEEGADR